jgi:hypothetical protein
VNGEKNGNRFPEWVRIALMFVTAAVACVVFVWTSQANQDEKINLNTVKHAVLQERLKSIDEKLGNVIELLDGERRR